MSGKILLTPVNGLLPKKMLVLQLTEITLANIQTSNYLIMMLNLSLKNENLDNQSTLLLKSIKLFGIP